MNAAYNKFRRFCAFLTGAVLLISGILKLMDPTGAGLVVKAYFDFLHIGFMNPLAKTVAVTLALAEGVLGSALMSGVWRRITGIAAFSMMGFFTLITIVLAIANPAMDCGCFGEAVHLTHLQSLVKNLILDILLCIAFIPFRDFGRPKKVKYVSFGISALSLAVFMVWSLISLPLKDYTDFAPGKVLAASDNEDYISLAEPVFIYEKDGERKNFRLDNLPDSSWTFVDSKVIEDEFTRRPVLSLRNGEGNYCDSIAADGQLMAVSVYRKLGTRNAAMLEKFLDEASSVGYNVLIITADEEYLPEGFRKDAVVSDYKTIITLNRSNGGVTYISDGQIVRKWSGNFRSDIAKMTALKEDDATSLALESQSHGSLCFQGLLLYVFAVLLLL